MTFNKQKFLKIKIYICIQEVQNQEILKLMKAQAMLQNKNLKTKNKVIIQETIQIMIVTTNQAIHLHK